MLIKIDSFNKVFFFRTLVVILMIFSSNAFARSTGSPEPSENVSIIGLLGSAVMASALVAAGEWIVTGIKHTNNNANVTITMYPTKEPKKAITITLPAEQLDKTPLKKGQKVQIETAQTGYLLKTQGNNLGFLPNQKGESLLHSESYD